MLISGWLTLVQSIPPDSRAWILINMGRFLSADLMQKAGGPIFGVFIGDHSTQGLFTTRKGEAPGFTGGWMDPNWRFFQVDGAINSLYS
jgi:hypothetical protein